MKQWILLSLAIVPLAAAGVVAFPSLSLMWQNTHNQTEPTAVHPIGNTPSSSHHPIRIAQATSASTGFPQQAIRLAAATGRRIVPHHEAETKKPYRSVGRFFNEKEPFLTVGAGVLINFQHVLTAAHVIEKVREREQAFGSAMFQLPGGTPTLVGDAELDAGWRQQIVTADIGVCRIDVPEIDLLDIKVTNFDPGDEPLFSSPMRVLGYDLDIWMACGGPPNRPPLVERTGRFSRIGSGGLNDLADNFRDRFNRTKEIGEIISTIDISGQTVGRTTADVRDYLAGSLIIMMGTYEFVEDKINNDFGWKSEAVGTLGCDGGPVIVDNAVLGVAGYPVGGNDGPGGINMGFLMGTRLTGPVADMVENFAGLPAR